VAVSAEGSVESIRLLESAGCEDLDEAARRALERAWFEPGTRFGSAIASRVRIPIRFRLTDR
jgi:TonB family protein